MAKAKSNPKKILERVIPLDTERLYGPLPDAIKYLQEIRAEHMDKPDLSIDEHWPGYEDVELRFLYHSEETDEEYQARLQQEEYARKQAERDANEKAAKAERRKKWEALNREFGRGY